VSPVACRIVHADVDQEQGRLLVQWGDGHESRFVLRELRAACPCAACRSARSEAQSQTSPFRVLAQTPASAYTLSSVEPVGRYGMRILWGDGHGTGIYTFAYLRQLCPCEECVALRPEEPPFAHGIRIPR
jgi:DUF971 family protein